jgi:hypothetical protein
MNRRSFFGLALVPLAPAQAVRFNAYQAARRASWFWANLGVMLCEGKTLTEAIDLLDARWLEIN